MIKLPVDRGMFLAACLLGCLSGGAVASEGMPEFSWNTIPRYMHVRKMTAFTPEEVNYLAKFPLITLEKTTGMRDSGSVEAGSLKAAEAVKAVNPDAKILYYRNIIVHYGGYAADKKLKEIKSPFLADRSGNTKLIRNKVPAYDLSNNALQKWWLENAREVCASKAIDGLFIDGNIKALEKGYLRSQIGAEKRDEVTEGYHFMMKQLPSVMEENDLLVANVIRARFNDSGLEYLDYFDGSYIEGFEHAVGQMSREDYVAKGIEAVQKAARSGKIIAFTFGTGAYADTDMDEGGPKSKGKRASLQDRLTYTMAIFLVCAEKHSYFMLSDGYGVDKTEGRLWMNDAPEYSRPLGPPKGPAKRNAYVYERSFEHADVRVDIEKETAEITWKPAS
ncbi:putative glycoside hydrolase [Haloferula chungangensis]|uniref:Glycoside hydrolase n=1 Tax=Haloferula chungangensis TaxID=1048331 RepID=A0ABW2LB43_9BACT